MATKKKTQTSYEGIQHAPRVLDIPLRVNDYDDTTSGTVYTRVWDSYETFLDHVATFANGEVTKCRNSDYREDFYGGSFANALELARNGWSDQRDAVELLIHDISESLGEIIRVDPIPYFDVSGGSVDIGRYLDGEPECMLEYAMQEVPTTGRVVRILVRTNVSGATNKSLIIQRGAMIGGLIAALRLAGLSPEIYTEWNSTGGRDERVAYLTRVVEASQDLDMDTVMFAMGHPSYVRRLSWSALDNDPKGKKFGRDGYYGKNGDDEMYGTRLMDFDVVVNSPTGGHYRNVQHPTEFITDTLRGLGVHVGE